MSSQEGPFVLIVDDDASIQLLVKAWLADAGYRVGSASSGEEAIEMLAQMLPDLVCLDVSMPGIDGIETLERIRAHHPFLQTVMMTADTGVDTIVKAMNLGAYDYLAKPITHAKLLTTVRRALEHSQLSVRLRELEREVEGRGYGGLLGRSESMKQLFREMDRVASGDITVLIHGESGSGKELVARAIHRNSGRRDGPFVALNCAAIPETLQEAELFGYEKGAFTGADKKQVGRFEQADGGTLFLDEVAELSEALQAKLLRAIQDHAFHRVGGREEIRSDFRLLTATHKRLDEEVRAGRFREDFYFRVAVFELEVPPLRDRGEDIFILAEHFLRQFGDEKSPPNLTQPAKDALLKYPWPGNVRELEKRDPPCNGGRR